MQQIADFIYLLREDGESKDILQRRFKKDTDALKILLLLIGKLDEMGYHAGIDFAFSTHRMDYVKADGDLSLIEIRVDKTLWRVITYWNRNKEKLVMLDAFEHHKHRSMSEMVNMVKERLEAARELLEEVE